MTARTMPPLWSVADYWTGAEETYSLMPDLKSRWIGWGEPFCFACGWLPPVADGPDAWRNPRLGGWLERAHLADHWNGGSAHPSNLVPLCHLCHEAMPPFDDRPSAIAWVGKHTSQIPEPYLWQAFTDAYARAHHGDNRGSYIARTWRLRGDYLELLRDGGART